MNRYNSSFFGRRVARFKSELYDLPISLLAGLNTDMAKGTAIVLDENVAELRELIAEVRKQFAYFEKHCHDNGRTILPPVSMPTGKLCCLPIPGHGRA